MPSTPVRGGPLFLAVLAGLLLGGGGAYFALRHLAPHHDRPVPEAAHERAFTALLSLTAITSVTPAEAAADWPAAWNSVVDVVSNDLLRLLDYQRRVADIERRASEVHADRRRLEDQASDLERQADELIKCKAALNNLRESTRLKMEDLESQLREARKALAERSPEATQAWPDPSKPLPVATPAAGTPAPAPEVLTRTWEAGSSALLRQAVYDSGARTLGVTLADGTILRYREVPRSGFDNLRKATQVDTHFRMRVVGAFACDADDAAAVRKLSGRR